MKEPGANEELFSLIVVSNKIILTLILGFINVLGREV